MEPKQINIVTPKGRVYTISGVDYHLADPFCDCKGFTFRGTCSHVEQILKEREEKNGK